jgi:hypothetical protein
MLLWASSKKRSFCKLDFTLFVKCIGEKLDKILITVIAPTLKKSCGDKERNIVVTAVERFQT